MLSLVTPSTNSAISSPSGYYAGYGFAVPSNLARKIVEDIYGFVENVKEDDDSLDTLDDLILLNSLDKFEYQTNWKPETRIKKLIELGFHENHGLETKGN